MLKDSSIDFNEVEKFSKIANEWWDVDGKFKSLHKITPLRIQYIKEKIAEHFKKYKEESLEGLDILDIGCGGGLITVPLHTSGANVTAIDASIENIKAAINHANSHDLSINYLALTPEELSKSMRQYDVVICLEVIEHVADNISFIKVIASLLKPGGMLVISTINRNIKSYFQAIILAEYILNWVPKNTHEYKKFVKPSELYSLLNINEIKLIELRGLTFHIPTYTWQLTSDINVNYFGYAIKYPLPQ